jgi:16S rRNA processing protein RimM
MAQKDDAAPAPPATAVPPGADAKHRVCVARIGAAHGTRGEVRLWPFTADPEAVGRYGALETADGSRLLQIEALRPGKDFFVARFKDITDRSAAERLRNVDLYVPRERLPAPAADEFYHADMIGLRAEDTAGTLLGTVIAIHNFGAGDLLEIAPPPAASQDLASRDTILVPFTVATVPEVSIPTGRIVIDAPAGLLEPAAASRRPRQHRRDGA